jgi:maleate isomerase
LHQAEVLFGTIVPSSNVTVERVTQAVLADFPEVGGLFARVPVVGDKVHLSDRHDIDGMLAAADLLAHAAPAGIVWNGSKGAGLGLAADRDLCRRIEDATGIPATTSVLVLADAFAARGIERIALVTPFSDAYVATITAALAADGIRISTERHREVLDNRAIAAVSESEIEAMALETASSLPDAVLILCTNLMGAGLVQPLEARLGLPVFDSVSAGVWGGLRLAGVDTRRGRRWGSLFGT